MMVLHTRITPKQNDGSYIVLWRTGTRNKGAVRIEPEDSWSDERVIAELVAIRFLLFNRTVFNRMPVSGKGYRICASQGAIRKLVQGRSNKEGCQPYADFLRSQLEEAEIAISNDMEFLEDIDITDAELINVDETYLIGGAIIEAPAMGKVVLSRHAVHQYLERVTSGKPQDPWASLIQRLLNPELRREEIPDRILEHKQRRFGRSDNVEAWSHPNSKFIYLVVNDGGYRTVVTCFERAARYRA
ncbi:hypothetical protein DFO67_12436 [Modicisalibacter xianhensis]|uniref:Uncharacterized protein n=1 Tax=Modicisalibacter xianhensis TaxID=442341 RepID=A0A4R8FDD4_9GAMM|nr:hypothetical protein [Halomonas xianhensis]TDX23719.1 hypothetical protein DFO67_12436 [Halomonas xianhensis]